MRVLASHAEPGTTHVLLSERDVRLLREVLRKPKGSDEAKALAGELRAALKEATRG